MRDLRAACIHGRYEEHSWGYKPETDGTYGCPGGREVTIESLARKMYERATTRFPPVWDEADQEFWMGEVVAAIGDTDEPERKPRIGTSTKRGSR